MNYPGFLLAMGSSGDEVREIQNKLNTLGFNAGTVDGIFGEITRTAVIEFQNVNSLVADGIVGKLTWDKLFNSDSVTGNTPYPGQLLSRGSRGEDVRRVQQRLNLLGYNAGTADGIFGPNTETAVINFQGDNFLSRDGIVGPITWNVLFYGASRGIGAPYPGFIIGEGYAGDEVKLIQNQLNRLGFNAGAADGIFGPRTRQAVISFQQSRHIQVDGIIGPETWNRLMGSSSHGESINDDIPYPGVLLSRGSTGELVRLVQEQLNAHQYYVGAVDGIFGPITESKVREFQRVNGLAVDGIVGPLTWDVLFRNSNSNVSIPYPGYLISLGSSGEDVRRIQRRLNGIGYNVGAVDGIFGPQTRRGVVNFQRDNNLDVDGIVGPITWSVMFNGAPGGNLKPGDRIYPGYLIAEGSRGEDVRYIQERLKSLGYYTGNIDGIFGPLTRQAVRSFQHDHGLQVDGIVGPVTWNALVSATGSGGSGGGGGSVGGAFKIFIDPGHGGHDPGAVGNGLLEKNLNLDISLAQKELLEAAGYTVRMSRSSDSFLSLKQRTDMANAWGADLFISNHVNAGGGRGSEVWASIYNDGSRTYANEVARNLSSIFYNRGVKTRQGQRGDYFHVIRETKMPAFLIEHGFIDNAGDAAILSSSSNRRRMAEATVNAIKRLSPLPREEEKEIRPSSGFYKLLNLNDRVSSVNPTYSATVPVPNLGEIVLSGKLITSGEAIDWDVERGITKEQLQSKLNGEITSRLLDIMNIEQENLTAWLYEKELVDENLEEIRIDLGKINVSALPPSVNFNAAKVELLFDTNYRDWKIHESVTVNIDIDTNFPNVPGLPVTDLNIVLLLLIVLIAAALLLGGKATIPIAGVALLAFFIIGSFGGDDSTA